MAGPSHQPRGFLRRPTTIIAGLVVTASAIAAVAIGGSGTAAPSAAHVGRSVITAASVEREAAAIEAQPAYEAALRHASTLALAAPVDPKALAAVGGDPEDLRVTLVPAGGAPATRAYTGADLRASVLTRLLYVTVLDQVLASHHVTPTSNEITDGRQQARIESGQDLSGASLFDRLPAWYQTQLAMRGASVAALERALVGSGGITPGAVAAAYRQRLPTDFTTVCLRVTVGGATRDAGCAPMGDWAPDVAADVANVPVGAGAAPLRRGDRVATLVVTRRTTQPLSDVAGNVRAVLSSRFTDIVNSVIEDQLALSAVSVAPHYGTYESLGTVHGVLPPDALAPASPAGPPVTSPPQRLDPFD